MIPKSIHLIWYQNWSNLPSKYISNVQSVVDKNPNYKIFKWDNDSIRAELKDSGQEYLDKYDSFKLLHQQVDYAKYFLLHKFGGISTDVDVFALKSFDETPHINDSDFIVSNNSSDLFINNGTILVSKNNPLLKEFFDSIVVDCKFYQTKFWCIYTTTGPKAFTEFVNKHRDKITVLDHVYFEPCSGRDSMCYVGDSKSILDHRHEGTWLNPAFKEATSLYYKAKHYRYQILFGLIILILLIVLLRKNNT